MPYTLNSRILANFCDTNLISAIFFSRLIGCLFPFSYLSRFQCAHSCVSGTLLMNCSVHFFACFGTFAMIVGQHGFSPQSLYLSKLSWIRTEHRLSVLTPFGRNHSTRTHHAHTWPQELHTGKYILFFYFEVQSILVASYVQPPENCLPFIYFPNLKYRNTRTPWTLQLQTLSSSHTGCTSCLRPYKTRSTRDRSSIPYGLQK